MEPRTFSRGSRQFLDQDYIADLGPEDRKWLSDFNETYYSNKFPPKSKPGRKTNMFDKAGIARKEIFDQTNARNRDVHTTSYKINTDHSNIDTDGAHQRLSLFDKERETIETELIDYLDLKRLTEDFMALGYSAKRARREAEQTLALLARKCPRR